MSVAIVLQMWTTTQSPIYSEVSRHNCHVFSLFDSETTAEYGCLSIKTVVLGTFKWATCDIFALPYPFSECC